MEFVEHLVSAEASPLGSVRLLAEVRSGKGVEPYRQMRRFPSYGLTFVCRGSGLFIDQAGRETVVSEGSAILTLPDSPHWFGPAKNETWDELFVVFGGPQFDLLRDLGHVRVGQRVLAAADPDQTRERLLGLCQLPPLAAVLALTSIVLDLSQPPVLGRNWTEEAKARLAARLDVRIDLEELAESLGVGYETFRKVMKRETGVSPAQFRARRRLELSQELLKRTSLKCSEIADRLGYADAFTYSKAFRREFGVSPAHFRAAAGASSVGQSSIQSPY